MWGLMKVKVTTHTMRPLDIGSTLRNLKASPLMKEAARSMTKERYMLSTSR